MPVSPGLDAGGGGRFPADRRLRRAAEFQRVFDDAVRAGDGRFLVLGRPNGLDRPRLGLAISMRAAGSAVARNRAKRAAREAFRGLQGGLGCVDFVVTARPAVRKSNAAQMRSSLEKLMRSVGKKCAGS